MTLDLLQAAELRWLTYTIVLTALIWVPYILNRIVEMGLVPAVYNPQPDLAAERPWANRMFRAHANAVENLVVFAPLVLVVVLAGASSDLTLKACVVYFFARLAHAIIYTLGVPVLRPFLFTIGFVCQMVLAWAVLSTI